MPKCLKMFRPLFVFFGSFFLLSGMSFGGYTYLVHKITVLLRQTLELLQEEKKAREEIEEKIRVEIEQESQQFNMGAETNVKIFLYTVIILVLTWLILAGFAVRICWSGRRTQRHRTPRESRRKKKSSIKHSLKVNAQQVVENNIELLGSSDLQVIESEDKPDESAAGNGQMAKELKVAADGEAKAPAAELEKKKSESIDSVLLVTSD